jgi:heme exporter protein CcmD
MNQTPFIVASYVVFLVVLAADALAPWLARRRVLARLRARIRREQRRGSTASNGTP